MLSLDAAVLMVQLNIRLLLEVRPTHDGSCTVQEGCQKCPAPCPCSALLISLRGL